MNKKNFLAIAFLGIATLSLIFAICCFAMDTGDMLGSTESHNRYGADFYTDVQNATAQVTINTYNMGQCLENFGRCVATMFGFTFIIVSLTFGSISINMIQKEKLSLNYVKSQAEKAKNIESEEKSNREVYKQEKHTTESYKENRSEEKANNGGTLLKYEKTLSDKILDALSFQNDTTMIGYLRSLKDEKIDEILNQPVDTIRDSLVNLLHTL